MTDTSDKAIEAMADSLQAQSEHGLIGVPRGHVFVGFGQAADLILALQAERNQLITTAAADARVKAAVQAGNEMVKQLDTMMLMLSGETAMTKHSLERALSGALDARNMWTASMSRKD